MLTVKDVLGSFHRTWHPVQSTAYAFVSGFDPMADSNILPGPASIGSVDHGSDASSPCSLRPRSWSITISTARERTITFSGVTSLLSSGQSWRAAAVTRLGIVWVCWEACCKGHLRPQPRSPQRLRYETGANVQLSTLVSSFRGFFSTKQHRRGCGNAGRGSDLVPPSQAPAAA